MDSKKIVLVRTYSAGVHFGELVSREGKEVVLANARRIWQWRGAHTLNEIATSGCNSDSRISVAVARVTLTEAIEIIDVTEAAAAKLATIVWA